MTNTKNTSSANCANQNTASSPVASARLPIVIYDASIHPNEKGWYCLNEIARAAEVDKKKHPNQWRTKAAKEAERLQEMQVTKGSSKGSNGGGGETWADELTALKYAGWVSHEFESMVYEAFAALRNNSAACMLVAPDIENKEARELFMAQGKAFLACHDKKTQHDHWHHFKHVGKGSYQGEVDKCNDIAMRKVMFENGLDQLSISDAREIVKHGIDRVLMERFK